MKSMIFIPSISLLTEWLYPFPATMRIPDHIVCSPANKSLKVSYYDKSTHQLLGSHTAEGWNINEGLTLEQDGNEVTARIYRDNMADKEEVISAARIAEWVKVNGGGSDL